MGVIKYNEGFKSFVLIVVRKSDSRHYCFAEWVSHTHTRTHVHTHTHTDSDFNLYEKVIFLYRENININYTLPIQTHHKEVVGRRGWGVLIAPKHQTHTHAHTAQHSSTHTHRRHSLQ